MGAGALVSGRIRGRLAERYVEAELLLAVCGGLSSPLLLAWTGASPTGGGATLRVLVYGTLAVLGTLVGLELPLLVRLSKTEGTFADLVSRALAFDYAGALVAALAFPLVLVPYVGLARASLATAVVNVLCALSATWMFGPALGKRRMPLQVASALVACGLVVALAGINPAHLAAE